MLIFFPEIMSQVYYTMGVLFGPLLILMVIFLHYPENDEENTKLIYTIINNRLYQARIIQFQNLLTVKLKLDF